MTGTQAVVRLLLMQKEMDRRAGLNTAGLVTGYRGSPLGGVDAQMHRAKPYFDKNDILFMPGLNEDLAATAIWGAQQAEMRGEGKYRRRLLALVRQGAGRRSQRRRAASRQSRRLFAPWRRAGADGRRSHRPNPPPPRISPTIISSM